ncbi:MAG TPA: L-glutamate gamma-semialdehyde dehydrogenase [Phycisphaerae bacterium]|nr:L-glutamate gamma-semialdehyde dehydrogenase [Phycisphaerae bacterium]
MLMPFSPEPYVDFTQDGPRSKMLAALEQVGKQLGRHYPLHIGGKTVETKDKIQSVSPADPDLVVGVMSKASADQADQAVKLAAERFKEWASWSGEARGRILVKAAAIARRRVYELAAWQCYEVSKSWIEAYADVCEGIDFMDFYGREAMRLDGAHPVTPFPGEENEVRYMPLGVGVIIPPWNFPFAICCGMTTASLVTGNTTVLKPASTAPVVAAKLVEILHQAGLPAGVLNFVPGSGAAIGDTLVCHPLTRFIAFTGSMEVGLGIFEKAARMSEGQIWLKRTILEMGGKDCIVVDETADLDAAAEGVVAGAFGFQGQKCSACSRLIVHKEVHQPLLERVVARAGRITIGNTTTSENFFMGAVIDPAAQKKNRDYIGIGKKEGKAVLADGKVPDKGYFVPPTIIDGVDRNARIAQEEIFGPVLAVIEGRDFDDLLSIANGTIYGLTGALYSNDRQRLERARRELHVGNLYLNRKCTGALVDVQPFGGFNMSGTDSKAGGRDYLQLFMQAKSITERF